MKIDNSQLSLSEEPHSDSHSHTESNKQPINGSVNKETSTSPVDTIPFSVEGIQTVVKNHVQSQQNRKRKSLENGFFLEDILRAELQRHKDENVHLRSALKEASKVNQQWRNYHDQRQGYVQKLLATIHDLQQSATITQTGGNSNAELMRLKETLSRQQKDHREHIQLLQLQVKAHRDDWEAERNEKITAETGRTLAESQLASLHEQLEHATVMLEELENRLQHCHCHSNSYDINSVHTTGDDTSSLNDGSLTSELHSPTNYENGIKSRSRSSSNSGELSASVSPSPIKKLTNKLTMKNKIAEVSKDDYKSTTDGLRSGSFPSLNSHTNVQVSTEDPSQELVVRSSIYEKVQTNRLNNTDKNVHSKAFGLGQIETASKKQEDYGSVLLSGCCIDSSNRNGSPHSKEIHINRHRKPNTYYESKGARPKILNLGKIQIEDEKQAKHRARSILASALPMSPSSSIPSSPVAVPPPKMSFANISNGYIPITSTVLSSTYNSTSLLQKLPNSNAIQTSCLPVLSDNCKAYNLHNNGCKLNNFPLLNSNETISVVNNSKQDFQTSTNLTSDKPTINNGCSAACNNSNEPQPLKKQCNLISLSQRDTNLIGTSTNVNCSNETVEIDTTANPLATVKRNKKVIKIANGSHDKLVTNYASISVMPRPISAVCSNPQGTSTGSSRSSSPGISLTTFALNANGQGVPGAMFLALGAENSKSNKATVVHPSSKELNRADPAVCIKMDEAKFVVDNQENISNGRLVNSTWVKLMDKENSHLRSSTGTPWRTARAVPSHQLNSVKRLSHEDNSAIQESRTTNYPQISHFDLLESSNSAQYESSYNASASVSKLNIASCHSNKLIQSVTDSSTELPNNSTRHFNSPTATLAPHGGIFQFPLQSRSDLMTMASRNISSAILNYEFGNKFQRSQT